MVLYHFVQGLLGAWECIVQHVHTPDKRGCGNSAKEGFPNVLPGPRHRIPNKLDVTAFSETFPVFLQQSVESLCTHYRMRTQLRWQGTTRSL